MFMKPLSTTLPEASRSPTYFFVLYYSNTHKIGCDSNAPDLCYPLCALLLMRHPCNNAGLWVVNVACFTRTNIRMRAHAHEHTHVRTHVRTYTRTSARTYARTYAPHVRSYRVSVVQSDQYQIYIWDLVRTEIR